MVLNFQLMFNKRLFLTKRRRRSNRFLDLIRLIQSLNPVVAYSISRRLSSSADKLIRVRLGSDNSEIDIGFVSGILDTQALIDFGGYNLLGYTEDLTNPVWTVGKTDVSFSAVVSSGITAPDNTNTAFNVRMSLEGATGGGDILDFKQNLTQNLTLGENYSTSIFLRSGDGVSKTLGFFNIAGDRKTITIGTEWQKYEFTNTSDSNGSGVLRFRLQGSSTDNLVNLEVWHPQAEIGSTATEYQPRLQGGASDCFVTTWYDQIGSNHATQTIATNQPKIYDVLTGDVTRENGKPAMVFDGSASHLELVDNNLHSNINGLFVTSVLKSNVVNNFDVIVGKYGLNNNRVWRLETNRAVVQSDPTSFNSDETTNNSQFSLDTNQMIASLNWSPSSPVQIHKNNVVKSIANTSVSALPSSDVNVLIGGSFGQNGSTPTSLLNGQLQEIVIFNRSLDNNTSLKLVSDINDHYSIAPLVEILSPIVAYSISRRLSSIADKLIRVRLGSDNSELDIGFKNNVLDTQALIDFGGYNLLGYTEDLTNAVWTKSSAITINPSTQKNPIDEGAGVFLLKSASSDPNKMFVSQLVNGQRISGLGVISGYFKSDGGDVQLRAFGVGNQGIFANFDLTNGTVGTVGSSVISATIEASENGFYHCKLFVNHNDPYTAGYVLIDDVNSGELPDISTPDIGFFIYGTQMVQGSTSLPYQPRLQAGASDCFVTTLYDQIGSNHATQTVATNQPKIYDVLTGDIIRENGKPAMVFDGVDDFLLANNLVINQPNTFFAVGTTKNSVASGYLFDGINERQILNYSPSLNTWRFFAGKNLTSSTTLNTNQNLFVTLFDGSNSFFTLNGNEIVNGDAGNNNLNGLKISSDIDEWDGTIQEIIIFDNNLTPDNRQKLHDDINDHYGIF